MADLILTLEDDGAEEADGASADEEGAPILSRERGGFLFSDLASDDDDLNDHAAGPKAGSWNFDAHQAVEDAAAVTAEEAAEEKTGLEAKIRARLREKLENDSSLLSGHGDEGVKKKGSLKRKKLKSTEGLQEGSQEPNRAQAASKAVDDHLRTGIHFADLQLSRPLLRAVADLRFESPTPIQRDVIPPALRGLDVLATAETGSGKTASFLLPTLERLCQSANVRARRRDASGRIIMGHVATKAMVLIPTRELAVQCHAMLQDLAKFTMVTYQLVAGGYVSQDQASSLRQQPDIVVATPGRLLDHLLNSQSVHMELLEIVVFDEADRLLELGFREECQQVLKRCSKGRQTMLFSATMNTSVEDLAALALVKPVRVHANPVNRVAETLEQEFVKVPSQALREAVLLSLCKRNYTSRVIVFCATKQAAHRLAMIFGLCRMRFAEIHGNLTQQDRVQGLQRFQQQEADFLLATDLAARGLDLMNVETVINFHLPLDVSRYIHRVGRTARMGRAGRAVTVYCPEEYSKVKKLGRQCCTKVKSKVLKRTVAAEAVQQWADKIDGFKEDIESILQDEALEKELRLADMLSGKSDNMERHKEAIHSRPAKTWYMNNNEKQKLRSADAERVMAADAAERVEPLAEDATGPASGGKEGRRKRKGGRGEETEEAAEERQKKRAREKFLERKAAQKTERLQEEKRIMARVRRARKAVRPIKAATGVEPRMTKQKKGKRKKG